MSGEEFTLDQVLSLMAMENPPPLDAETIDMLRARYGKMPVSSFEGASYPVAMRCLMAAPTAATATSPDVTVKPGELPPIPGVPAVARVLMDYLRKNEYIGLPGASAPAAPVAPVVAPAAFPTSIKLERDKAYPEMGLKELLTALADNPDDYDEIMEHLRGNPLVARVERRHPRVNWAIPDVEGSALDVAATMEYLRFLDNDVATPQESFRGRIPSLLARLFRRKAVLVYHMVTGQPSASPDEHGFDISGVHPDLHRACLWAVRTGYRAWQGVDAYEYTEKLVELAGELPTGGRLLRVYNAYRLALQNEEPEAMGVVVTVRDDAPERREPARVRDTSDGGVPARGGSVTNVVVVAASAVPASARTEDDYRRLLEEAAMAPATSAGSSLRLRKRIYPYARSAGGSLHLDDTILLGNSAAQGGSVHGRVYVPRGVSVTSLGGSNHADVYPKSYKQLYEIACGSRDYGIV